VNGRDKPGHDAERWFWAENRQVIETSSASRQKAFGYFALSSRHGRLVPAIHVLQNISMRQGYVYFLTNRPNGTLYVGVTSNLAKRVYEYRTRSR